MAGLRHGELKHARIANPARRIHQRGSQNDGTRRDGAVIKIEIDQWIIRSGEGLQDGNFGGTARGLAAGASGLDRVNTAAIRRGQRLSGVSGLSRPGDRGTSTEKTAGWPARTNTSAGWEVMRVGPIGLVN